MDKEATADCPLCGKSYKTGLPRSRAVSDHLDEDHSGWRTTDENSDQLDGGRAGAEGFSLGPEWDRMPRDRHYDFGGSPW